MDSKFVIICPLAMLADAISPQGGTLEERMGCMEDTCAWYDEGDECCAMLTLARKAGREETRHEATAQA